MKKVFLLLTLIAATFSAWGATVTAVTKTVAELKGTKSWSGGNDYTNIALDNAITLDHGKYYTDESGQLRYYYQNDSYASKFTLSAKTGVIIHSVNFKYSKANNNVVLSDVLSYGKNVPDGHAFESETTYLVDANSKTFYNSVKSGSSSGGNLNILSITVTYISVSSPELLFAEASKTVCKNAEPFINPLQNKGNGAVTYESSNKGVATVESDGTITVKGVGSTTITATAAATALYTADTESYTLTVTPNLAPVPSALGEYKVMRSFGAIADQMGLEDTKEYSNQLVVNNVITVTAQNGGYRPSRADNSIYIYKSCGAITFSAREGAIIKSIKLNWKTRYDGGFLTAVEGGGKGLPASDAITSGTTIPVNAKSKSFWVGTARTDKNNPNIHIQDFEIVYYDPSSVLEKFTSIPSNLGSTDEDKSYKGDNGLYSWIVRNCRRGTDIKVDDANVFQVRYNGTTNPGYLKMNGNQGGIKDISFEYKSANKDLVYHFFIKKGDTNLDEYSHGKIYDGTYVYNYTKSLNLESNTAISIFNPSQETTQQTYVGMGPLTITPYLLFKKDSVTFDIEQGTTCDLNSALINNTGATPTFTVEENTAGGNPMITNGILDFSSVVRTGTIKVQAAWGSVTTTLTLTINLKDPDVSFADTIPTEKISTRWYKQALTLGNPSTGTISYKVVSKPDGAEATMKEDTVRFDKAGDYIIRGILAASLPYGEDSAQYKLKVTALNVPELSFAKDTVEKPLGSDPFINDLTTSEGVGDTTYTSSNEDVATVDSTGLVTVVAAGTTNITASVAENASFAAGQKSYFLKVFSLSEIAFASTDTSVYLNAPAFTRKVTKTAGDGEITYSSSAESIATVDANGKVTLTGTASGPVTITAIIAKTENFWADTATYTLNVSSLKLPTASFTDAVINKNQNDTAFTKEATTLSDGTKHYFSSDTRVATVNETTGKVTMGEKPGTTTISVSLDASDTWAALNNAAQYTLNVSAAPIADMKKVATTVGDMKGTATWPTSTDNERAHYNIPVNDDITLNYGKYYVEGGKDAFRYYYGNGATGRFTLQAKAGMIIKSVKFTYTADANTVLTDAYYSNNITDNSKKILSDKAFAVDGNAVTFYVGKTGDGQNHRVNVTGYEITCFDPSTGVAVTKSANDLAKDLGLKDNTCYDKVTFNQAISINTDPNYAGKTLRYGANNQFNCYRWCGPITIKAREGATIHYVKVTYTTTNNAVLTKYFGTEGKNIPAVDRIASDSIIYVNADSLKLYVGSTTADGGTASIKKIYVNYTDGEEVVVDNFNNCTSEGSTGEVEVEGVGGKYDWTFTNFSRKDSITNRMYYDQSVLINKGGKISTQYTGGLKELAFDWHPSEKSKAVKFYVIAGGETITVDSAAMADKYTINFKKQNIKSNGEFAIAVDNASATTLEVGHVSLTPYILYTDKDVTIAAKDYKDAGWKYTNNTLINYTGQDVTYSITDGAGIASINSATGEVTILGGGTVTVNATADDVTASYQLTINLEATEVEFAETAVAKLLSVGSYTQKLTLTTAPAEGNTITYSFVGDHDGATLEDSTVTFTKAGTFTIQGKLEQNLPYAADSALYTLTVNKVLATPEMNFAKESISVYLNADPVTNELTVTKGDGAISYESGDTNIATVNNDGLVSIVGAGTTTITANSAATEAYLAGSVNYSLTVSPLKLPTAAYTMDVVNKNQKDAAFTNTTLETESDGKKTYESSNPSVATVNDTTGEVTMGEKPGTTIITVKIAASDTWEKIEASYTLNVSSAPLADMKITTGNVPQLATQYSWNNDNCYTYFKLDDNISISSTDGNAKYLKVGNENCLRYYHKQGTFTIRAKAGVIIKAVKFNYYAQNDGVIASAINGTATEVPADKQLLSGVTYPVDGSVLTFYAASTSTKTGSSTQVRITDFEVTYFDPSEGVAVTKSANDLAKDLKLKNNTPYQDIAINNVITLHADANNTMKYYTTGNINCYRWTGPIDIKAREGATIHYVKITYNGGPRATLTKYYGTDGKNIPASDRIASDSILYVNANSLRLYVGDTLNDKTTSPTLGITKIYVNYTDKSEAIVENFDNCNTITTTGSVDVKGVDSTYDWKITNFTRDSVRRIYYDQSIMLRTKYGQSKIETVGTEGGYKEISFDWFPTTPSSATQFTVKAGDMTDVVDSAAMVNSCKITYTKTGIKSNGAFSIEIAADQAKSYVEFGHISLTPYLLYTTKSASVKVGDTYTNADMIDNRDNTNAIAYESSDTNLAEVDTNGQVTAKAAGEVTITATWDGVSTTYTLTIAANELTIDENDADLATLVADNDGKSANVTLKRAMTADGTYNTIYLPFALSEDQVTTVFGTGAKVAELTSSSLDGNILSLNFDFVTATEAGKPYLVAPTQDVAEVNVGQVTISKDEQESTCEGGNFHGILAAQNIAMSGKYFLGNENKLITYTAIPNYDTKGLRAYFTLNNPAPGVQARCVIGRGTTTVLPFINGEAVSGTKKVIKDNQLIIIRDGKLYNAQGIRL